MREREPKLNTLDVETVYALVSKPRRRVLLCDLSKYGQMTTDTCAQRIAAWEHGCTVDAVEADAQLQVMISLVHNHLPQLAEHGVVDYMISSHKPVDGKIGPGKRFNDVEPFLEHVAQRIDTP